MRNQDQKKNITVVYMDKNSETTVFKIYSIEIFAFAEKKIYKTRELQAHLAMQAGFICPDSTVPCGAPILTKPNSALAREVLATGKEITTKCNL